MKLPKLVQGEPARSADAFAGHGMQPSDNSIGHDKNSVRSPDSGAGLEQLGPQTGESDLFRPVYTCGEPVEDEHVAQMSSVSKRSTKTRCRFQRTLGGAVVNDSRAIVSYGGKVCPCLITGTDARSDRMIEELGDEFSSIRVARAAYQARRSIIVNGHCYTARDPLDPNRLPTEFFPYRSEAAAVLIAPLPAENHEFVDTMLQLHPATVWQPSVEQLADADRAFRLMNSASITVMNQSEAETLTGEPDPIEAIMVCRDHMDRDRMDRGVIVTTRSGAVGWFSGNWAYASAPVVDAVVREVGAGDWFAGVFTLAWSGAGYDFAKAMALGQAAAARYVAGLPAFSSLDELADWYSKRPKTPIREGAHRRLNLRHVASAAIATLAAAAILSFWLLLTV